MLKTAIRRIARARRGQTMVLGALGCFLVALMMLMTLNVGKAIFEKIQVQQVADAAAFSTANQEARSFNFYAYTNRANIGALVSANTAHSYMSMSTAVPELYFAAAQNFDIMAGMEYERCCCAPYCPCVIHCFHGDMDQLSALYYRIKGLILMFALWNVDKKFKDMIEALDDYMDDVHKEQKDLREAIEAQVAGDQIALDLISRFDDEAMNTPAIAAHNAGFIGSGGGNSVFETEKRKHQGVPTELANGTREGMRTGGVLIPAITGRVHYARLTETMEEFMNSKTFKAFKKTWFFGKSEITVHLGESRIIKGVDMPMVNIMSEGHAEAGEGSGGADMGIVHSWAFCDEMYFPYSAWVGSGKSKSSHMGLPMPMVCMNPGSHKNFKCLNNGDCFMLFKANDDPAKDHGQPKAFSFLKQNLAVSDGSGAHAAWELNPTGNVKENFGDITAYVDNNSYTGYETDVQIADIAGQSGLKEGMALSKAMVYYHLPPTQQKNDHWKEHPNFFNPFWKSKLQPFRDEEAVEILNMAGAGEFVPMVGQVPIP